MTIRVYFIWGLLIGVNILWASSVKIDSVKTYTLNPSKKVQGTIERLHKFPSKYITPRHVDVWMPENYDPKKRYNVLYAHDGQMLYNADKTWNGQEFGMDEHLTLLGKQKDIKETIVVGIWNVYNERNANYFPLKVYNALSASSKKDLQDMAKKKKQVTFINSDAYLKFIVEELKPYIDRRYSTKVLPKDTAIMGSSRGGLISLYAICEYPEVFGAAACLSTHWIGTYSNAESNEIPYALIDYMMERLPSSKTHKIYFDYGTEKLDAKYLPYQDLVTTALEYKDYDENSMKNLKCEGHEHSENFWNKRLKTPLKFILN